jgi:hypothetical protein
MTTAKKTSKPTAVLLLPKSVPALVTHAQAIATGASRLLVTVAKGGLHRPAGLACGNRGLVTYGQGRRPSYGTGSTLISFRLPIFSS